MQIAVAIKPLENKLHGLAILLTLATKQMSKTLAQPPIGILDSGVGGLSVLTEIHKLLPQQTIHYIGDSEWCPYGNKSPEQIRDRVFYLTNLLLDKGCGLIVIACNSATICAVEALRAEYMIPFTGMEPAVKPAVESTRSGVIGILATEASLAGEKFHRLLNQHGEGVKIITTPCPEFVELVEAGNLSCDAVDAAIHKYAMPMIDAGADTLVLGCTHYPFLKQSIQSIVGENITLIDTGSAVAKQTRKLYQEHYSIVESSPCNTSGLHLGTTGNLEHLTKLFPLLCPELTQLSKSFSKIS